ncbi:MAG: FHA domain-containing protein, partial [Deltaproteobacteria bacterium]|nr:FHA domain-containing protein [Deltaproteobacteria bacterium]
VSSSHLTIDVRDSGIFVTDLGSTNGTYLDGRKLAPHQTTQLFLNQPLMLGGTVRLTVTSPAVAGKPGPARKNVTQILD